MIGRRRKDLFWFVCSILFLWLAGLLLLVIKFHRYDQHIPSEHLIGNRATNVKSLEERGLPFSFLVIGDTHIRQQATALIKKASKADHVSFMIILGDFVKKPNIWNHRYFLTEMTKELNLHFPVFLVPGNHDIDYTFSGAGEEGRVTPEVFNSLYGSMNFDFAFNGCLFVICGVDTENQASYLNYLRDILSKKGTGKRHIFLFIHHPPRGVGMAGSFPLPYEKEFFSLLEAHRVTSCFFGDYHAYWRGQRRGTNLIISGGGGRLMKWQPEWGKFHHILRITVDEDMIREEMIILKGEVFSLRGLRKWVFIHLSPILKGRDWVLYSGVILFLSLGTFSVACLITSLRRKSY